ncbi:hypothetical protein SRHO_G00029210 [Serrasalmus rhombeus]
MTEEESAVSGAAARARQAPLAECCGTAGRRYPENVLEAAVTIHRADSLKASQNWQVKRDESQNSASAESRVSDSSDCCPQEDVVITEMMS